ncbi:MAG: hypothetical protein PHW01_01535 [Patescibacteria group bacterium]|nr:hypothetical protein [Patescibacteria group bacterium]
MIHQGKYVVILIAIFFGILIFGTHTANAAYSYTCHTACYQGWICIYCADGSWSICSSTFIDSTCTGSNPGNYVGCATPSLTCSNGSVLTARLDYFSRYGQDTSCGGYCQTYGQTFNTGSCSDGCIHSSECALYTCPGSTCSDSCGATYYVGCKITDCSCAASTCVGSVCYNSCGGTCAGTKSPSCSCAANTCVGSTCSNGCGGTCAGTKAPSCACAANTCTGSTCSNGCGGTCAGTKSCLTLTAALSASPASITTGQVSNLTTTVGGTATGAITYSGQSCGTGGTISNINYTNGSFSCTYSTPGYKYPSITVTRAGLTTTASSSITVTGTLTATLTASPASVITGQASDLTTAVGGTITGTITYSARSCGADGTISNISGGSFRCRYSTPGTKTASITVTRGGLTTTATTNITVTCPSLPAPLNARSTAQTTTSITWAWNAVSGATYYLAHLNNNTPVNVGNVTTRLQSGLTPSTSYWLEVAACDLCSCSAYSPRITAKTLNANQPPWQPTLDPVP